MVTRLLLHIQVVIYVTNDWYARVLVSVEAILIFHCSFLYNLLNRFVPFKVGLNCNTQLSVYSAKQWTVENWTYDKHDGNCMVIYP